MATDLPSELDHNPDTVESWAGTEGILAKSSLWWTGNVPCETLSPHRQMKQVEIIDNKVADTVTNSIFS